MLKELHGQNKQFNVLLGFDGFVDKILKPIQMKCNESAGEFQTMKDFAEYISAKSGMSCSIDLETMQEKIGGNMPIAANALGNLGCHTVCVGAMGYPEINPIFKNMNSNCELVSVSNPGYCNSLEFGDGKLMLATNTDIDQLDYAKLVAGISKEKLIKYFEECDATAFLNWGELIHSNDIWENILKDIIPKCKFSAKKKMLIDFSDFSKRRSSEVKHMLSMLEEYSKYFDIVVSINENELSQFMDKLQIGSELSEENVIGLSKYFTCEHFVVHLLQSSWYVSEGEVHVIEKEVIKKPKIITGGGDNFNAGLLFGLLIGLDIESAIKLGAGVSCLYVRDAKEVSFEKLVNYISNSEI